MGNRIIRRMFSGGLVLAVCGATVDLRGGGSGLNTVVVVNQSSSNSCELANYFCERRAVPPENVLGINWPSNGPAWSLGDFQTNLLSPLLAMLSDRQLTNQVDYVVLAMDIPSRITSGTAVNSTTSALFYGFKDDGPDWNMLTNSYFASEQPLRQGPPASATGFPFLATMLTSDSLTNAMALVDRGVNSDRTFPTQAVVLAKSSDSLRNIRFLTFDNAIFNVRLAGRNDILRTNYDSPIGPPAMLGFETGLAQLSVAANSFVPGAMADSLTSFGGVLPDGYGQTTLLAFINAGAAGSYGTVTEPTANPDKFPAPQTYFYQARGFNIAECYYQSVFEPYEGLIVAEPLASPFAHFGSGNWTGIASNAVLSGIVSLSVHFGAAGAEYPLQQVDLFLDGKFFRTLTNVLPATGNTLTLNFKGQPMTFAVPAGSSVGSVAAGLGAALNTFTATNPAKFLANVHGDRIELRSTEGNRPRPPMNPRIATAPGTNSTTTVVPMFTKASAGTVATGTTYLLPSREVYLDSLAYGNMRCQVNGSLQVGSWLNLKVTKTNGTVVSIGVTNTVLGAKPLDLVPQLTNAVNSSPALTGPAGIALEEFGEGAFQAAVFRASARSAGYGVALARIALSAADGMVFVPAEETNLTQNLSDLQPRNHVYIRAGVTDLVVPFTVDTRTADDGYHDLTAAAYEGSHVRTQTRISIPFRVRNTALTATMTLLDLTNAATAQGIYHIQVTSSTNATSEIRLFTTGGQIGLATNQSNATFAVNGSLLGAGLHPFYARVKTTAGQAYRTQAQWVRFSR